MAVTPWVRHASAGAVLVQGETHRDWLQRLLAGDVNRLSAGRAVLSALTNAQGRWVDLLLLLMVPEGVLMLTLADRGEETVAFLRRRVLFRDRVTLTAVQGHWAQADGLAWPAAPKEPLAVRPLAGGGWAVRLPPGLGGVVRWVWPQAGPAPALPETPPLDAQAYAAWRVARGVPGPPEWRADFTPWETGPHEAVSLHKGCFPGQEVLARQANYGKVTRLLVRLTGKGALRAPARLRTPAGQPVGMLTTAAGEQALGVVRRPHHRPGTRLLTDSGGEVRVQAVLVAERPQGEAP